MDKRFPVNEKKQPELDETINFGFASRRSRVRASHAPLLRKPLPVPCSAQPGGMAHGDGVWAAGALLPATTGRNRLTRVPTGAQLARTSAGGYRRLWVLRPLPEPMLARSGPL